jgi:hypothetical protein
MRWQCSFVDKTGKRCENEALHRLHFASEHPFNHVDICDKHFEEYSEYSWVQDLFTKDREIRE